SGPGVLHGGAPNGPDLGEAGVGRVLGLGRAADFDAGAVAALYFVPDFENAGAGSGPARGDRLVLWRVHLFGRAAGVWVDLVVAHAASSAGGVHQRGYDSGDAQNLLSIVAEPDGFD